MKKVLSIVLSLVMVLCMVPTMAFADSAVYSDIEGEACEASVELLTELGVVDGYEDGTYQPGAVVTRAEMAKLIVTQLGLNPTSSTTAFTDMDAAKWAIPYVGYAESLGVIKGYGDGTFGPNNPVTYDEVVTMIVRAIGYTEACNEMQGQWPAVFVQKANELGILKKVATTGNVGANRGDVAIMLANALDVQMVYADGEGVTQYRNDDNGAAVTMYSTLVAEGGKYYGTISDSDVENATKNITDLLGAAGQIVYNEDDEVISVSDIKSTFMTGKFNAAATTFTSDGVAYKVAADAIKVLNAKGKAVDAYQYFDEDNKLVDWDYVPVFNNATVTTSAISTPSNIVSNVGADTDVTIACITSGKTITAIFSAQKWEITKHLQVSESDADQIENSHSLLGVDFAEDVDGNIDEEFFLLEGVDSLDEIAEDHIVYVYAKRNNDENEIAKIAVGTEVVTGEVTRMNLTADEVTDRYFVIDGTKYNLAADSVLDSDDFKAGDVVTLNLDYNGKVYTGKVEDGTAGNYAVVLAASDYTGSADVTALDNIRVQLMTADGAKIFPVNTNKVTAPLNGSEGKVVKVGAVVQYALDSEGQIKELKLVEIDESAGDKVSAKGYLNGAPISDSAVIFAAPLSGTPIGGDVDPAEDVVTYGASSVEFNLSKTSDISVLKKDNIINTEIEDAYVYALNSKGAVVFLMVSSGTTSADDLFGVATSTYEISDGTGVTYIIGTEDAADAELDGSELPAGAGPVLYKIKKNTDGSVTFTKVVTSAAITIDAGEKIDDLISMSGNKITFKADGGDVLTSPKYLADDVIVYIYDESDKKFNVNGIKSDIYSAKNTKVILYSPITDDDNANNGLITHVIVVRD